MGAKSESLRRTLRWPDRSSSWEDTDEVGRAARPPGVRRICAAAALAVVALDGCATARNYLDPSGPIQTGAGRPHPATHAGLRVVTFNLKFAQHLDRAIALLSRPGPLRDADLLVMQEMDGPATRRIAEALGFNHVYVPSAVHPATGRDFGVAILSPWPLEVPRKLPLPHQHRFRKLRRAAAVATMHGPLGPIRVYGVHLESPTGLWGGGRRDQARAIVTDLAGWDRPVVVAGDFNGRGGPDEIAHHGFFWATRRVHHTAGLFSFDHILARGLCAFGADAAAAANDDLEASDHVPVWALLGHCDPSIEPPTS